MKNEPVSISYITTIIKTRSIDSDGVLGVPPVPLASMEQWWGGPDLYDKLPPRGWEFTDGGTRKRKDYDPVLAERCRTYTSWYRWHILRQFRLPLVPPIVGIDPA